MKQTKGFLFCFVICGGERGLPCGSAGKESACNEGDLGLNLGREDPPEKGKAPHSSVLAWRTPRTV